MKQIYVGNIPFQVTEIELKLLFEQFGNIEDIRLIKDAHEGRPKVFCFIKMEDAAADKAIANLNQSTFGGRKLNVAEAKNKA